MISAGKLAGKKLLVLGGTAQQTKFVEAARHMGVSTVVVDYLEDSPAKAEADASFLVDIKDVKKVVAIARRERVDGIICGYIDPAQRPYQEACGILGVPCYGTKAQFRFMTDKQAFKELCADNGVDVIPSYSEEDVVSGSVRYPVFVKPADSRGSRGQRVCFSRDDLLSAEELARAESSGGRVLIERYMRGLPEFQVTYFFVNGEAYILRTADSYTGPVDSGLEKVVLGAISPSVFTGRFLEKANGRVVNMFKSIGLKNGPVFMQGFVDGDRFRFFDPGLRFPGVDYDRILHDELGIDVASAMVEFALTGDMPKPNRIEKACSLDGCVAAVLFPAASPGVVGDVSCFTRISKIDGVVSCIPRVRPGDCIAETGDINQRIAEIDLVADNMRQLSERICMVQREVDVRSLDGEPMTIEHLDVDVVAKRAEIAGGCNERI